MKIEGVKSELITIATATLTRKDACVLKLHATPVDNFFRHCLYDRSSAIIISLRMAIECFGSYISSIDIAC